MLDREYLQQNHRMIRVNHVALLTVSFSLVKFSWNCNEKRLKCNRLQWLLYALLHRSRNELWNGPRFFKNLFRFFFFNFIQTIVWDQLHLEKKFFFVKQKYPLNAHTVLKLHKSLHTAFSDLFRINAIVKQTNAIENDLKENIVNCKMRIYLKYIQFYSIY